MPLRICADLANRTKHLVLTQEPWIDKDTAAVRQDVAVRVPSAGAVPPRAAASHAWTIEADGQSYDALNLARDIVHAWEQFLRARGLLYDRCPAAPPQPETNVCADRQPT